MNLNFGLVVSLFAPLIFAALPSTSSYKLNSYGFGSGGTANSGTSSYSLEGISGELSGQVAATSAYKTKPGFIQTQQANVPKVTLTNPSNYYDKLHFVIDQQNNPSDAKYALQISTDNFSSDIRYVKSDLTVGTTLTLADYQTYSAWGGAAGANIIGLAASTTYQLRAKATQGNKTESGWGPISSAATVGQSFSFCLFTSDGNCSSSSHNAAFGPLLPATVTSATNDIKIDFATNADFGGNVYIYSASAGLNSTSAGYNISSASTDLSSATEGYGAQVTAVSQSSGGPFNKLSPYDGSSNNVGILSTDISKIFSSTNPLTGGSGTITLKARSSSSTPSADDYADTLTLIAAASF